MSLLVGRTLYPSSIPKRTLFLKRIARLKSSWGFSSVPKTNMVALSTYSGQIALIDYKSDDVVLKRKYDYKLGGITVDNSWQYLFVVAIAQKKVFQVQISNLEIIASYDTGADPDGMDISKDGKKLFVTNRRDGTISVITIAENTSMVIDTGGKPELINSIPDRSLIYASNFDLNVMHVIDTETNKILYNISGLKGPEGEYLDSQTNMLYISNFNSNEVYAHENGKYDTLKPKFSTGKNPLNLVTVDRKLYVSNFSGNSISMIDLK